MSSMLWVNHHADVDCVSIGNNMLEDARDERNPILRLVDE
jgi:hypothetical protein